METNQDANVQPSKATSSQDSSSMAALIWVGTLLFGFLVPLIVYLVKKDDDLIVDQSKEALNWGITSAIGFMISAITMIILIGMLLLPLMWVLHAVFCIMGAINASKGQYYRLPFNLRLVK